MKNNFFPPTKQSSYELSSTKITKERRETKIPKSHWNFCLFLNKNQKDEKANNKENRKFSISKPNQLISETIMSASNCRRNFPQIKWNDLELYECKSERESKKKSFMNFHKNESDISSESERKEEKERRAQKRERAKKCEKLNFAWRKNCSHSLLGGKKKLKIYFIYLKTP